MNEIKGLPRTLQQDVKHPLHPALLLLFKRGREETARVGG